MHPVSRRLVLVTRSFALTRFASTILPRMSVLIPAAEGASRRSHTPPSSPRAASSDKKPKLDESLPTTGEPSSSTAATTKDGKPLPRNAPAPGPRKVVKKNGKGKDGKPRIRRKPVDEVVLNEIMVFLGDEVVKQINVEQLDWEPPAGLNVNSEVTVRTGAGMTAHGNTLALYTSPEGRPWVLSTPFALPDELIRVRIDGHSRYHSNADLLEVVEPNEMLRLKEGEGVGCKYFGKCGGCQFQNTSYANQLLMKRETVRKAFQYFSNLDPSLVPEIGATIPSPKEAGYRTKITPHFRPLPTPIREDILTKAGLPLPKRKGTNPYSAAHSASRATTPPPPAAEDEEAGLNEPLKTVGGKVDAEEAGEETEEVIPELIKGLNGGRDGSRFFPRVGGQEGDHEFFIGFDERITKKLMDIEECPLATPIINQQYAVERRKITQIAASYAKDASLLLRDSSHPKSFPPDNEVPEFTQVCITNHKDTVHERVGDLHFVFPAGSFFQNNNSILPSLTDYVRQAIFEPPPSASVQTLPTHLVDTYCGSGLFAITLSPHFEHITGIEIDPKSIMYAERNAKLNKVDGKCVFKAGKSEEIFETVTGLPWDKTAVVIDPPRKGCDEGFLNQLVQVHPQTVVYVSCNVHTQARDVGYLLKQDVGGRRYVLESLRGFDLFPQTAHVEGVAVLRLQ